MLKFKGRNLDPSPARPTDVTDIVLNDLIDVTGITVVTDIVVKTSQS
jgi:hypothetical protein